MAQVVQQQVLPQRLERARRQDQVCGTKRSEQQQLRVLTAPRDRRNDVERAVVDPMQILEDEHERHRLREDLERLAELTDHPLATRSEELALECGVLLRPKQRRQLNQPGRCVGGERVDDQGTELAPRELTNRFEKRVVGFLAAEAFYRLTACHRHTADRGTRMLEGIHQAGLPDARLADDEDHLPPSLEGLYQTSIEVGEWCAASDERVSRQAKQFSCAGSGLSSVTAAMN